MEPIRDGRDPEVRSLLGTAFEQGKWAGALDALACLRLLDWSHDELAAIRAFTTAYIIAALPHWTGDPSPLDIEWRANDMREGDRDRAVIARIGGNDIRRAAFPTITPLAMRPLIEIFAPGWHDRADLAESGIERYQRESR